LIIAHYLLLQRNLLYTAITRGKYLVIIVGSSRAMHTAYSDLSVPLSYTPMALEKSATLSLPVARELDASSLD
jgi:exodeoxyribonuclease V alpha subunit